MPIGGMGANPAFVGKGVRTALTNVFAGAICSVLSIAYCLSYAALIFTGPISHLLAYGVAATFLSAAIGGAIVAWGSSLSVRGRRTRQLNFGRHRGNGGDRCASHRRTGRHGPSRTDIDRYVAVDRANRHSSLHSRLHSRRPRYPLRALSGNRWLSRRYRLADDDGRGTDRDRSAGGIDEHRRFSQSRTHH